MVRRSSRNRQQPTCAYDEELRQLAEKKNAPSQDSDSEAKEVENEVKQAMMEEDGGTNVVDFSDADDGDDEEDFGPKSRKRPSPKKQEVVCKPDKSKKQRMIQIKHGSTKAKKPTGTANAGNPKNKRTVQAALAALSNKVLDKSETPNNSLFAALLCSAKPIEGMESSSPRPSSLASHTISIYTPQLEGITKHLLQENDSNSMHVQLLNLLFRSVGGNSDTNLDLTTDLDDLDDNEWDTVVTKVVQVMGQSDIEVLTVVPTEKVGPREYRSIYKEFWYRLGVVVLTHTPEDGGDDDVATKPMDSFTSNRFQVELMRDLVARVTELVLVGQPDLRAAASTAVWELSKACMERTVELAAKLDTAQRQYSASAGQSRKMEALQHSMDTWKRHKAELEAVVEEAVIQGVFIRRYRDSNPFIRCESLETLSRLLLLRPDLFLRDKYLKYFGWMTSDKVATVRLAALKGLLAPFKHKLEKRPPSLQLDLHAMKNVCTKFLPRIVDCTEDSQSLEVQDIAMQLMVKLMHEGFLDEWEDDAGWDQLNLKAMDPSTSPNVRKNALYLILDQLDCFDDGGTENRSLVSVTTLSERQQIVRIDGLARWVAHLLCNGPVHVDKIKVDLTDYIMQSLREMPEHKGLTTNWVAMLKAIRSENSHRDRLEKEELAKTRVLLRMLECAARLEVDSIQESKKKRKQSSSNVNQLREALSHALLKSLPNLLVVNRSDPLSLRSLVRLPQYLLQDIFSLPTRKSEFESLLKNLCQLYGESTDEDVLNETAKTLSTFLEGNHARVHEVKVQLKRLGSAMKDRLMALFDESDPNNEESQRQWRSSRNRSSRRSTSSNSSMSSQSGSSILRETDVEHSIFQCLGRWRILMKQVPLSCLFDEFDTTSEGEDEVEGFCKTLSEAVGKRLIDRKLVLDDTDEETTVGVKSISIPSIWKTKESALHAAVASTVENALDVLLCILSWKLVGVFEDKDLSSDIIASETDNVDEDILILRIRNLLTKLIGLCYEQYLHDQDGLVYSEEHENFAASVQVAAGRVASDLRTLFPREWATALDMNIRRLALIDDFQLIGGFIRYVQSNELMLQDESTTLREQETMIKEMILPVARALTANWVDGNRMEAGVILSHLAGSGKQVGQVVHTMARLLKKIHPVRFLESQMAALRMSFKNWLENEPSELETDNPSQEQLKEYEKAERDHQEMFHAIEQLASRLSMCLGVGKLSDQRLEQAILNFMQEGIRFAFEGEVREDDDLVLGSRLPFLRVLSKYSSWVRKKRNQKEILVNFLLAKETALRAHPEYEEVHEDDLQCITTFKESLGITMATDASQSLIVLDEREHTDLVNTPGKPGSLSMSTSSRRRIPSTAGSHRSRISVQSNLSPLLETQEEKDERNNESPSPQKKRRLAASLEEQGESPGASPIAEASDSDESVF